MHEIAVQQFIEKIAQLVFQDDQVYRRRSTTGQIGNLAVDAAPVAGVVGIEVDADRNTSGTARHHRIDVTQSRAVAVMICYVENFVVQDLPSGRYFAGSTGLPKRRTSK